MNELELVPLCSALIPVSEVHVLENTPQGNVMIGELHDSVWEGDRFRLVQKGRAAADWLTAAPDGTGFPDVRLTLESDDGALVLVDYTGRFDAETGIAITCPRFTTGAPELAWLNRVQAVGKAFFDAEAMTVTYPQIYEIR